MTVRQRRGRGASIMAFGRPIFFLLVIQLLSGIVISPLGVFFPIYLEEKLGYAAVFISASFAIGRLPGMIASVIGGAVSDTLGHKWTLALGLIGFILGSSLFLVRVPWLVISLWAISSLGMGFHALGGQGYLIDSAGADHLGVVSALYHWGFTLGGALISPAAGALLDYQGFGAFGLVLLAISSLTALGAMAFLPGLPRGSMQAAASWSNSLLGYGDILRSPVIIVLGLLRFLPTCYYGLASVLNPLLINRVAGNKTAVAQYATISLILATLAQMLVGRAADRWGRRGPTLATFGVLVAAIIGQASFANHLWSFYTFGVLGISAAWSLATLMPLLVADATATHERGRVLGMLHLLWNVGMMVGSMIGGALVDVRTGLPFLVTALLNIGAIALVVLFFRLLPMRERSATEVQT